MNIIKLHEDNNGGGKHLLVFDASRVVSAGERPVGHYVNEAICAYSDSQAIYVEGIRDTVEFTEEPDIVDGVPLYKSIASCIIPKYRPAVMEQLRKWDKKRFVVLVPDRNGKTRMIGTRSEPAMLIIDRNGTGASYDSRNEIEISFVVSRRDKAYNYVPTTVQVQGVGVVTIGNRVHTA